ncbi:MAG: hypothetical protein IT445_21185 [Phycisphaeraceae bacterium]|nr:hypothetical protein [Phycisphaeraceae bacterium]
MLTIDKLWNSNDSSVWDTALRRYWDFVKPANIALEGSLERLTIDHLKQLDAQGWYRFLREQYFRWKYTASNRYASTTRHLDRYVTENALDKLHKIKLELISLDPRDIAGGLTTGQEIRGLGCAGASGLLALLYPRSFGTVDQFVVKALREITGLPEANVLRSMNEESLTTADGVVLIQIMMRKADQLNRLFETSTWTARNIDKILWTYGRGNDSPRCGKPSSRMATSIGVSTSVAKGGNYMTNHEMFASALRNYRGKTLRTAEIERIVLQAFPNFTRGSLLPNDHGQGNKGSCSCAGTNRRIFDKVQTGLYLVR